MDTINIIVTALALGAAAGIKPTAEQAVKDAYAGLKAIILEKYHEINLSGLENKPDSDIQQLAIAESLKDVDAGKNEDVLQKAKAVLAAVEESSPDTASDIGIDMDDIRAASLTIDTIIATGRVDIRAKRAKVAGDIVIKDVKAGNSSPKK